MLGVPAAASAQRVSSPAYIKAPSASDAYQLVAQPVGATPLGPDAAEQSSQSHVASRLLQPIDPAMSACVNHL